MQRLKDNITNKYHFISMSINIFVVYPWFWFLNMLSQMQNICFDFPISVLSWFLWSLSSRCMSVYMWVDAWLQECLLCLRHFMNRYNLLLIKEVWNTEIINKQLCNLQFNYERKRVAMNMPHFTTTDFLAYFFIHLVIQDLNRIEMNQ